MGHHIHLTLHEREDIMIMRRDGKGVSEIARAIRRDKSTVSRELSRNSCARSYRASTAQRRYSGFPIYATGTTSHKRNLRRR